MDCKYVADKVWLYVEGDLQPRKQQIVARHIASCRDCAGLVEEAAKSQEWLKSREPERFDDAALDGIRTGARQKIAELAIRRFKPLGVFDRLDWKPLIIACPVVLLIFLIALHLALETAQNRQPVQTLRSDGLESRQVPNNIADS